MQCPVLESFDDSDSRITLHAGAAGLEERQFSVLEKHGLDARDCHGGKRARESTEGTKVRQFGQALFYPAMPIDLMSQYLAKPYGAGYTIMDIGVDRLISTAAMQKVCDRVDQYSAVKLKELINFLLSAFPNLRVG